MDKEPGSPQSTDRLSRPAGQVGFPKVRCGRRLRSKTQEFSEKHSSGDQHRSKVKVWTLSPGQLYYTFCREGKNVQGIKR